MRKGINSEATWKYCPECGSDAINYELDNHKECKKCHQEWFSDIDYTDTVRMNLEKWQSKKNIKIEVEAKKKIINFLLCLNKNTYPGSPLSLSIDELIQAVE